MHTLDFMLAFGVYEITLGFSPALDHMEDRPFSLCMSWVGECDGLKW
jgi:hypothetical protein